MVKKVGNPNWSKGVSGNPEGRPRSGNAELEKLRAAVAKVEGKNGKKKLYEHFIDRCYENDSVLIAFLKKMVPDLRYVEGDLRAGLDESTMAFISALFISRKAKSSDK